MSFNLFYRLLYLAVFSVMLPVKGQSNLTAKDFFRAPIVTGAAMSPPGNSYALLLNKRIVAKLPSSELQNVNVINVNYDTRNMIWLSDNILVLRMQHRKTQNYKHVFLELVIKNNELRIDKESRIESDGEILAFVPEENQIVFARISSEENEIYSDLFLIELFDKSKLVPEDYEQLNRQSGEILFWMLGKDNKPKVGVSFTNTTHIWLKEGNKRKLRAIWRLPEKSYLEPVKLDDTGRYLTAITDFDSDKKRLLVLDLVQKKIAKVLFDKNTTEIDTVIKDKVTRQPYSVSWLQNGLSHYEVLPGFENNHMASIEGLLALPQIDIVGSSEGNKYHLVVNSSGTNSEKLYYCDIEQSNCELVASLRPWFKNYKLADTVSLSSTTYDGLQIESFLTLPNTQSKDIPLIIMPHGGPIGVRDNNYFNPNTQWLAYNGLATLRVNYRGSAGYGKELLKKGYAQWGRAIEKDIEQATDHALSLYDSLNKNKMCIFGSSYGGYSAIMGIIRNEDRYQCAVSFAGVTDLSLLFARSRVTENKKLYEILTNIVGDPQKEPEQLRKYSPLYQFQKITRPLLLIHGTRDKVVDIEHALRLNLMLETANIPHEFVILEDIGHGFGTTHQAEEFYQHVTNFLSQHLK